MPAVALRSPAATVPDRRRRTRRALLLSALFLLASAADWGRLSRSDWDTFYAEDGRTFVGDWLAHPSPGLLLHEYAGYQQVLPRLLTFVVTRFAPVQLWAKVDSVLACTVVGGVACVVFVVSRDVVQSAAARVGLAAIPVLLPLARFEAVGDVANLHWYMLYLLPWVLLALPRSRVGAAGLGLVALVAVMTEPQCAMYLPLAVFVWFRQRPGRPAVLGWVLGTVGQAITYAQTAGIRPSQLGGALSAMKGYAVNVLATDVVMDGSQLGSVVVRRGWWVLAVAGALVLAVIVDALVFGAPRLRLAVAVVCLASVASWCASFFLNDHSAFDYDTMPTARLADMPLVRWGTGAALLLAAVVPLAAEVLVRRFPRSRPVGVGLVAGMLLVMAVWFHHGDTTRGGPQWNDGVRSGARSCAAGSARTVQVPSYPPGWAVTVPCGDLVPQR